MGPVCVCESMCVRPTCPGRLLDRTSLRYKFIFCLIFQFYLLNFVRTDFFWCIFRCLQTYEKGKIKENVLQPTDGGIPSLGTNRSAFGERRGVEEEEEGDSD